MMTDIQSSPDQQGVQPEQVQQTQPETKVQPQVSQPPAAAQQKSVLAVVSMVLGIIALLLSLLPIINNFAFILVILGVVFAIVGIVGTGAGKKAGRGFAIAGLVISIVAGAAVLGSQAFYGAAIDAALDATSSSSAAATEESSNAATEAEDSSSANAEAEGETTEAIADESAPNEKYAVTIDSCKKAKDYEGKAAAIITYNWTNNSDEATSFMVAITSKAYQNGIELSPAILTKGIDSEAYMKKIKPGKSLKVELAYELDDKSPVTVECSELISFNDELLAERTFDL